MANKTRRGQKQCPKCNSWVKGTRANACHECGYKFNKKKRTAVAPVPKKAIVDKPTRAADAITIGQVRAVADLVTTVGGFDRCHELLGVIRDVGGLRRMKDLLEAMSAAQVSQSKV